MQSPASSRYIKMTSPSSLSKHIDLLTHPLSMPSEHVSKKTRLKKHYAQKNILTTSKLLPNATSFND